ncbi:hypothetical protein HPB48_008489 [Haemaphysalis longicornis]|uniref:Low-density lipoprotein receptor n=1 Tax=Haemaphysalis longicornis TaxID=44386 RepID=A0A9J6FPS0_HAELO|nr:hypothetical protein HPB48_008489 [Haemaphysalis longicornis]
MTNLPTTSGFIWLSATAMFFAAIIATADSYVVFRTVSGRHSCSEKEFACATTNECIPRGWQCNGDRDCADASDEDPITCFNETMNCPPDEFVCQLHNGEIKCAPMSWQCDGKKDCRDGLTNAVVATVTARELTSLATVVSVYNGTGFATTTSTAKMLLTKVSSCVRTYHPNAVQTCMSARLLGVTKCVCPELCDAME